MSGIYVAGDSFREGDLLYDSRKQHLLTSLIANPPHLDILEKFRVGKMTVPSGQTKEQEVFSIKHGLPYTPECLVYFYVEEEVTNDPLNAIGVGFYNGSKIGSGTSFENFLFIRVDDTYFKIIHFMDDFLSTGPHDSFLHHYSFRIKYYIFSLDSKVGTYDGSETTY
jgi:hypothetical protein